MLRRRLLLEWWAALAAIAAVVLLQALLILPQPNDAWSWPLAGLVGALLLAIGLGAIVAVYRHPLPPVPRAPARFRDRDLAAAATEVRHGRSVEPPELQAAAIDLARRSLRSGHISFAGLPMSGTSIAGQLYLHDHPVAAAALSGVFVAGGVAGLVQSRRVQHRLDTLEDTDYSPRPSGVSDTAARPVTPQAATPSPRPRNPT